MPYRPVLLYSGLKYGTMDMRKESMVYAWNIPGSGSRSLSDEEQGPRSILDSDGESPGPSSYRLCPAPGQRHDSARQARRIAASTSHFLLSALSSTVVHDACHGRDAIRGAATGDSDGDEEKRGGTRRRLSEAMNFFREAER